MTSPQLARVSTSNLLSLATTLFASFTILSALLPNAEATVVPHEHDVSSLYNSVRGADVWGGGRRLLQNETDMEKGCNTTECMISATFNGCSKGFSVRSSKKCNCGFLGCDVKYKCCPNPSSASFQSPPSYSGPAAIFTWPINMPIRIMLQSTTGTAAYLSLSSRRTGPGSPIYIQSKASDPFNKWILLPEGKMYRIQNTRARLCIDNLGSRNKTFLRLAKCKKGSKGQLWYPLSNDGGLTWYFGKEAKGFASNLCLGPAYGRDYAGTTIWQHACDQSASDKFVHSVPSTATGLDFTGPEGNPQPPKILEVTATIFGIPFSSFSEDDKLKLIFGLASNNNISMNDIQIGDITDMGNTTQYYDLPFFFSDNIPPASPGIKLALFMGLPSETNVTYFTENLQKSLINGSIEEDLRSNGLAVTLPSYGWVVAEVNLTTAAKTFSVDPASALNVTSNYVEVHTLTAGGSGYSTIVTVDAPAHSMNSVSVRGIATNQQVISSVDVVQTSAMNQSQFAVSMMPSATPGSSYIIIIVERDDGASSNDGFRVIVQQKGSEDDSKGAIIGGVLGGIGGAIILVAFLGGLFYFCNKRKSRSIPRDGPVLTREPRISTRPKDSAVVASAESPSGMHGANLPSVQV